MIQRVKATPALIPRLCSHEAVEKMVGDCPEIGHLLLSKLSTYTALPLQTRTLIVDMFSNRSIPQMESAVSVDLWRVVERKGLWKTTRAPLVYETNTIRVGQQKDSTVTFGRN